MQIIVAMSGRKQAGKNTIGQFARRYFVEKELLPPNLSPDELMHGMTKDQWVDGYTLECSFADNLKEFCIETLGLSKEACYGSETQKNAPTEYLWDDAPDFLRWKFSGDTTASRMIAEGAHPNDLMKTFHDMQVDGEQIHLKSGKMSGRDIMQIFGTDLIRQTFGNVWAKATVRRIKRIGKPFSVITDNRFTNEIQAVLDEPGGFIIRLTRSPFGLKDSHPSESALDGYNWDRDRCYVLDNANMLIEEQNEAVKPILDEIFANRRD